MNIKFHKNPYSVSRNVPCGRTGKTKRKVTFRSFAKAPKNENQGCVHSLGICSLVVKLQGVNMDKLRITNLQVTSGHT